MFYETGETKGVGELNEGTGEYKEYYISGKLKVVGHFQDDLNHGDWIYYDEEGNVEGKASFENGIGDYEGYYLNGDTKMTGKISKGRRIGEWTLYKKNGEIAGKYFPVYHQDNPIFMHDEDLTKPSNGRDYDKPEYKYKNKKSRYFSPVVNEYKGVILATNPLFSLIGFIPFSVEYYRQERLGYELQYNYIRSPFYQNHGDQALHEVYSNGFSLQLKQKFYSRDQRYGMFYFGHLVGIKKLKYQANVSGASLDQHDVVGSDATNYHYGVIIGNRWTKHPGNAGFTIDVYFGLGIGYRDYQKNYTDPQYDSIFDDINQSSMEVPVFFGINLGYLGFKKSKNLPVPSRK